MDGYRHAEIAVGRAITRVMTTTEPKMAFFFAGSLLVTIFTVKKMPGCARRNVRRFKLRFNISNRSAGGCDRNQKLMARQPMAAKKRANMSPARWVRPVRFVVCIMTISFVELMLCFQATTPDMVPGVFNARCDPAQTNVASRWCYLAIHWFATNHSCRRNPSSIAPTNCNRNTAAT